MKIILIYKNGFLNHFLSWHVFFENEPFLIFSRFGIFLLLILNFFFLIFSSYMSLTCCLKTGAQILKITDSLQTIFSLLVLKNEIFINLVLDPLPLFSNLFRGTSANISNAFKEKDAPF